MSNYLHNNAEEDTDNGRLWILAIIFLLFVGVLIYRIFVLQIVNGEEYLNDFTLKIMKERTISSTRGKIYDRNGELLAYNELAYTVTIEDVYESGTDKNSNLNSTLLEVIHIIEECGDKVSSDFSIILNDNGEYEFTVEGTTLSRFLGDVYGQADVTNLTYEQETSTANDVIDYLAGYSKYGIGYSTDEENPRDTFILGEGFTKKEILQIVTIRYAMSATSYQKYIKTTVATDVSEETVAKILENSNNLLGADISEDTMRRYVDSVYFSQILGYTGKISEDELYSLNHVEDEDDLTINKNKIQYEATDMIGKAGIEQTMETYLQGTKGYETVYVNNLGKVIETTDRVEAVAGNDLYLTIDHDLQVAIYDILEQKLAGILVSKIQNIKEYTLPDNPSATSFIIPIYDVYIALISNSIIDVSDFYDEDAKETEIVVGEAFLEKQEQVFEKLIAELTETKTPYNALSEEYQVYQSYIGTMLTDNNVIKKTELDTSDATYLAWKVDETISLNEYLNYCIAMNWIDVSKIGLQTEYSDSAEIYNQMITYIIERLTVSSDFSKKIYKYMIKSDLITGTQICKLLLEQDVISVTTEEEENFLDGKISAYNFMVSLIENLHITPAQLVLDPYSASCVVTNVDGEVLAMVSYPSYDNNKLANSIDSEYYAEIQNDLSNPQWNYATQQKSAPGSTFKMVSASAALEEEVVTTKTEIFCKGFFDRFVNTQYACLSVHGNMNVVSAIKNSCNSFFYEVGYQLGLTEEGYDDDLAIDNLYKYAEMFGLNDKSGVEIQESSPDVSSQYAVLSAIGQGSNNYTTVGLSRYVTTIANSGICYDLTLLDKVTDSNGNLLVDFEPSVRNIVEFEDSTWDVLQTGMRQVIESKSDFMDMDVNVAGKTGTAQENTKRADHALFVSYAPYEAPEITVTTRIAYGYTSNYAANVSRDVYNYYFGLEDEDEILTGTAEIPDTLSTSGE